MYICLQNNSMKTCRPASVLILINGLSNLFRDLQIIIRFYVWGDAHFLKIENLNKFHLILIAFLD